MSAEGTAALAGLRILVVEDEYLLASEVERVLAEHGAIVLGPAGSAEEALARIDVLPPDAAVLNVTLKDGPSAPVAAALKARGVPYVVVTGYPEPSEPELRDAPRLAKPTDGDELARTLARLARRRPPRPT